MDWADRTSGAVTPETSHDLREVLYQENAEELACMLGQGLESSLLVLMKAILALRCSICLMPVFGVGNVHRFSTPKRGPSQFMIQGSPVCMLPFFAKACLGVVVVAKLFH